MIILAIETSCDETSIAILENKKVLSNVTASQIWEQQQYGGVVPDLAAKLHLKNMQKVLKKALTESQIEQKKIDYIAYTEKPGLVICLQIGKVIAETLALYLNKPLISCNHLEGHIYASLLESTKEWKFPVLASVISGGHTQLYYLKKHLDFELLGQTLDDAIGECLDKVSLFLGYTYPGGPVIEKLALRGENTCPLPLTKLNDTFDFSFSGLKTAVRRIIERKKLENNLTRLNINNLACSLQHTLAKILTFKIKKAFNEKKISTVALGGGVVANKYLTDYIQKFLQNETKNVKLFLPQRKYCTDNAAMIGILAYYKIAKAKKAN
ncbi:tRNA (adenosine(37)-N6)-threonylcarbamoyltransferase complex transferase subunit TsaD [endosymbiont GvMRE of Glomus versiforme]|uniref:tRNA (adenosine(37)-N6)-threonylcarbamoyltransferase complex transferase subunit TsaD n=1 Tax=endosymbiont GvMRE of Glomus versiforme TaxID=2039283 RepID=UPI000EDEE73B|nr:tRNA (adenosine(37)-N6)-threonylcarbamoyltransferase complex transferase subunit TsaD [endosymbiont GvMRE of Glomus versiforme]RHZ36695.1 tRNA N6-adenosine threonylcarbamoyltransferase [endosymbiont GvMRE of Glomus versiforme]